MELQFKINKSNKTNMDQAPEMETREPHPVKYIAELENAQSILDSQETEPTQQGDVIMNLLETRRIAKLTL